MSILATELDIHEAQARLAGLRRLPIPLLAIASALSGVADVVAADIIPTRG